MRTMLMGCVLALGFGVHAWASEPVSQDQVDALKKQLAEQQQEINSLRAAEGDSWLTEKRAEQIKGLVHEVLADAETRASFAEGGMTAGWNDGNFFLASEDGNFLLNIGGQAQIRYTMNHNDEDDGEDDEGPDFREHNEGFSIHRAVLNFDGHLYDPRFTYMISILMADEITHSITEDDPDTEEDEFAFSSSSSSSSGTARLQNAWAAYELADGWVFKMGQFKAPFLRDESVHSSRQLAVERALVTDLLTVDYTQGAQIAYDGELAGTSLRWALMLHDGSYGANVGGVPNEDVDYAIATRIEALFCGTWDQFADYATWSSDDFGLMAGFGFDYENAEGEDSTTANDTVKWTLDVSAEIPDCWGFNAMVAFTGNHPSARNDPDFDEPDQYTLVAQAGLFIQPDKWDVFGRWEWIDLDDQPLGGGSEFDDDTEDSINFLTFGTNYYFHGHGAKFTLDTVWALDETEAFLTTSNFYGHNSGILISDDDEQVVLRAQFQFLF